ncbi:putative integration host factor (MihF) [Actinomycetota bacterium]|nr:putative integration host factor (MihF) [Actinomycetota bacterium]
MPVPKLSDEARAAALKKAAEARSARAALRGKVKNGQITIKEVLQKTGDPVIDKIKVSALLGSLPGYGKAKVAKVMEEVGVDETRRVKGLGEKQRAALIEYFS